ncbi:MAG TPA: flagellar hook capping FlgD N-terminal domain-containing protein [Syntrophorhabdaceae bacterium]|jgi:flagellar basal-body rod modification protein FlgD|nr:hypothetical protein [Syntrophorhabdaceae bacterium]MDI9560327.1 flagellar hook capping FlgD N-terminal domain-containing protein [Pseudomonadota bacterium]OQC47148.1 MAG: flagellar basal body rod modification protein [Deltaproteobacteria bacterium ADurb.Bin026]HNQ63495.1 flagellar hook capping FlgD N-terminal domain-containing protein [Syntrophorhabdaceae bacterium]HOG39583.1 flagellar hook capping FlgD N-terminal domain-containing protein [Syntrophorhabdaceae bacterium]
MNVSAINSVSSNTTTSNVSKPTNFVDKNDFLKILISQIKYQDPLEPMKPDQFLTQLSQLTQVEQLQNITDALNGMKKATETGNISQWISSIGKKMHVDSNTLSKGDEVYFTPQGDFDKVVLSTLNKMTGEIKETTYKKGDPLVYRHEDDTDVLVSAIGIKNDKPIGCKLSNYRVVKGIDTSNGIPYLVASNGENFSIEKVKQIKE